MEERKMENLTKIMEICINEVIAQKKIDNYFVYEEDFQKELTIELHKKIKTVYANNNVDIIVEYRDVNFLLAKGETQQRIKNSNSIDILVKIDKDYFPIEIKYSAYKTEQSSSYCGGSTAESIAYGFQVDLEKVRDLIKSFPDIKCGYCILLITTNLKTYINKKMDNKYNQKWKDSSNLSYLLLEINKEC
jgi:hypothetical protein